MGLEAPDADAAEQQQVAVPGTENETGARVTQPPMEANEADAAEQEQELDASDDEYR